MLGMVHAVSSALMNPLIPTPLAPFQLHREKFFAKAQKSLSAVSRSLSEGGVKRKSLSVLPFIALLSVSLVGLPAQAADYILSDDSNDLPPAAPSSAQETIPAVS